MRVSRAKAYWIAVAIFGLAISLPLAWVFSRAHHTDTLQAEAGIVYVLQSEDWLSPLVVMTGALFIATVFLAYFTFGLFSKTAATVADARQAAADVRSIIRGAGRTHKVNGSSKPNRFLIEASNSGEGPALIERVHWTFVEFTEFAQAKQHPYPKTEVSGEVVRQLSSTQ